MVAVKEWRMRILLMKNLRGEKIMGRLFESPDDAPYFYNRYGLCTGFDTRIHYHLRIRSANEIFRKNFVCAKQGLKDTSKENIKHRRGTRTGCQAMLRITGQKEGGKWIVDVFNVIHNHPLDTPSKVLKQRSHDKFHRSQSCKSLVFVLSKTGLE
ncbi:hypothetical protein Droror1_Dr00012141 [Drosera rotundifolia]